MDILLSCFFTSHSRNPTGCPIKLLLQTSPYDLGLTLSCGCLKSMLPIWEISDFFLFGMRILPVDGLRSSNLFHQLLISQYSSVDMSNDKFIYIYVYKYKSISMANI